MWLNSHLLLRHSPFVSLSLNISSQCVTIIVPAPPSLRFNFSYLTLPLPLAVVCSSALKSHKCFPNCHTMDLVPTIVCPLDPNSQRRIRKSYSVHTAEGERQAPQTAASGHVRRGLHRGSSGVQRAFDVRSRRTKQVWWL